MWNRTRGLMAKITAVPIALCLCASSALPEDIPVPFGNWRAVELLEKKASISVRLNSGGRIEGEFRGLDRDAIRIQGKDQERVSPRNSVTEVWHLRIPDRKINGILIGMGAGAVAGAIAAASSGTFRTGDTAGRQWAGGLIMAGIGLGALFGVAADTLIKADRLIYCK
jgi:hypothetical protein